MNIFPFKAEKEVGVVAAASSRTCRMGGPQEVDREPQDSRGSHRRTEMERGRSPHPRQPGQLVRAGTIWAETGAAHWGRGSKAAACRAGGRWEVGGGDKDDKEQDRDGGSPWSSLGLPLPPP